MTEVVASVRRVTDIIGEITAASQEQTAGIDQIYQAIMQMDDVTQQNAALIEQAAAAAASLKDQAGSLVEVVRVFKTDGSGMAGEPVSKPAAQPAAPVVRRASPKRTALIRANSPKTLATATIAARSGDWGAF